MGLNVLVPLNTTTGINTHRRTQHCFGVCCLLHSECVYHVSAGVGIHRNTSCSIISGASLECTSSNIWSLVPCCSLNLSRYQQACVQ
jgi:hypothetical protein